jgi:uncharacterized protein YndB with AHSA1/START domain
MSQKTAVTVESTIQAPIEKVWELWTSPQHITKWNTASHDWHTPKAENDLRVGGSFSSRMEARDGSIGFDFGGTYDEVEPPRRIAYTMSDGRRVQISFEEVSNGTHVAETFEAESQNPVDIQRGGWQAILDNFRKYAEGRQS